MSKEVLISVEGVSKKFCRNLRKSLKYGIQDLGNEIFGRHVDRKLILRPGEFWAVQNISFTLKRGECLGLIGRNGAGKTTLLRMLNGLIKPDTGRIEMRGRVAALIALGAGFNPVLTGRENIYVNAAVLGLDRREINEKFDEIVEFSELSEFIDMPIQSYSSGMVVRLGFAIASSIDSDVLILDEILAVGDAGFRAKCYKKIDDLSENTAVIFVSHSMPHIARMCNTVLSIDRGIGTGPLSTPVGIAIYEKRSGLKQYNTKRIGGQEIRFDDVLINNFRLNFCQPARVELEFSDHMEFKFSLSSSIDESIVIDITFHTLAGEPVAECNNFVIDMPIVVHKKQKKNVVVTISEMSLNPGLYRVSFLILSKNMMDHYDWLQDLCELQVSGKPAIAGQQFISKWLQT